MISRIIALFILFIIFPLLLLISFLIILDDGFPFLFFQKRVGKNNKFFKIVKFRTMKNNTPDIPTHQLAISKNLFIKCGFFLRKYSLDELPQLFNIIKGDLNFIGPRPALHNQKDLIDLRAEYGIDKLKPGITGWSQVNGRDSLSIKEKVELDNFYLINRSPYLSFIILYKTFIQLIKPKNVSH